MDLVKASVACKLAGMTYGKWHYLCEVVGAIPPPSEEEIEANTKHVKKRRAREINPNQRRAVTAYKFDGKEAMTYPDAYVAARAIGKDAAAIHRVCNGKQYSAHGYQWRYAGDPAPGPLIRRRSSDVGMKVFNKICQHCGRPYTGSKQSLYCSDTCRDEVQRERSKEFQRKKSKPPVLQSRICPHCGKHFESVSPNAVYCSTRCRNYVNGQKYYAAHKRKTRQNRKGEKIA